MNDLVTELFVFLGKRSLDKGSAQEMAEIGVNLANASTPSIRYDVRLLSTKDIGEPS
jgi:hypothetical protein